MKTIADFKIEFHRVVKEGRETAHKFGSEKASSISTREIDGIINGEFSHIEQECKEFMLSEFMEMMKEAIVEKAVQSIYNDLEDALTPCDDPSCRGCVAEKQRREESEQAKNGFTKSPTNAGNGTVN